MDFIRNCLMLSGAKRIRKKGPAVWFTARQVLFNFYYPICTVTKTCFLDASYGITVVCPRLCPSTINSFTPFSTLFGFFTSMLYSIPRNVRVIVKSPKFFGIHGFTLNPFKVGSTPKMNWDTFKKVQAAVPVSQLFFASPNVLASFPAIIWE